ncbi:oligopeptide transport system ATP-binding protein [Alloalcanivorax xenomutans]|uniref:ABC transporter ATP-binding protein n=1 Tax=Alloalcanivorax xenomutans TaxID=1094342 RepID=UPI000BD6B01B|nr:oligopeptide/dipeptide ABC transporter ATP-binding protein [Alloalcanivorax xenomutans]SOC00347.1 oligopeptide transport system ATP-binding protein [Alloalcanivorax xenomutans]
MTHTDSHTDVTTPLLQVSGLKVHFPLRPGLFGKPAAMVKAVDGVDFTVHRGETLGLVGESGCGKSTTGLAVLRMTPLTEGRIVFDGEDISHPDAATTKRLRRKMQMVYQDPFGALNPRMRVLDIIGEPLRVHRLTRTRAEYRERVMDLLDRVGLKAEMADRYPHEFSGGQRQRIGIARALAADPSLIICDEPVSALDVSIQAQVINLLEDLQRDLGLTYLFVAHDLAVVRHLCHRIVVMYLGRVVEVADRERLYQAPRHPYTQALLGAIPIADPDPEVQARFNPSVDGEVPSPIDPPPGCPFHPRCPHATDLCRREAPRPLDVEDGHSVACHLHDPSRAAEMNHSEPSYQEQARNIA